MADVEFSKDIYISQKDLDGVIVSINDDTIEPAIEIVLHENSREIERKAEDVLLFKDIKPYLQIGRNFAVVNREDWSYRLYEYRNEIPASYDDMFVYGIGMEDNLEESDKNIAKVLEKRKFDSCLNKWIKNRVQKWKVDLSWRIDYFYYIFRVIMMEMKSLEYMMIYRS